MAGIEKHSAGRSPRQAEAHRSVGGNRKVRPPKKKRTGLWLTVMALFFVETLFYVWCRVQCVNTGYAIDRETRQYNELLKERNTLKIELARLKSPQRIETIARTRLGLVLPDSRQTVTLP